MANVDFADLKACVSITDVLSMLNVMNLRYSGGALRGPCPICGGDPTDRHFVVTEGRGWYCHHCKNGGDIIKLVATVRQIDVRAAALAIQEHFGGTVHGATVHQFPTGTVPSPSSSRSSNGSSLSTRRSRSSVSARRRPPTSRAASRRPDCSEAATALPFAIRKA